MPPSSFSGPGNLIHSSGVSSGRENSWIVSFTWLKTKLKRLPDVPTTLFTTVAVPVIFESSSAVSMRFGAYATFMWQFDTIASCCPYAAVNCDKSCAIK